MGNGKGLFSLELPGAPIVNDASLVVCPFCNAQFALANAMAPTDKVLCPRCHEPLDDLRADGLITAGQPATPRRPPNWLLGLGIFAGMVLVAGIGLVFALNTTDKRRKNDPRPPDWFPKKQQTEDLK